MVESLVILLHIFSWFWQWNNFENRLIFGNVKAYKTGAIFWPPCIRYVTYRKREDWLSVDDNTKWYKILGNLNEFLQRTWSPSLGENLSSTWLQMSCISRRHESSAVYDVSLCGRATQSLHKSHSPVASLPTAGRGHYSQVLHRDN